MGSCWLQVFPSLGATLSNILADAYGAAESAASRLVNINKAQAERPDVVLVVVGSQVTYPLAADACTCHAATCSPDAPAPPASLPLVQLRTSDVRQNHRTGHLKALQQLLDEASSAAVVPHVLHEVRSTPPISKPLPCTVPLTGAWQASSNTTACDMFICQHGGSRGYQQHYAPPPGCSTA
jgi:hypothetical protein